MTPSLTLAELRGRATISVAEAAAVLRISTKSGYAAANRGEIPTLRLGARVLVPVPALLRLLGDDPTAPEGVTAPREVAP